MSLHEKDARKKGINRGRMSQEDSQAGRGRRATRKKV